MALGPHHWNFSTPAAPESIAPTLAYTEQVAEQLLPRVAGL
ncbi:hypothetical protein OHB26_04780 [Nocardia sp. NBC_01503]|nr:hypothetical protein [Nocardia sp. NBC_01503]WTL33559.1 hypothetical protein OHB26_04780 [Nocardia sp. NBC_01503]